MSFTEKVRAITLETLDKLEAANAEIEKLKKEKELYYKPTFEILWKDAVNKRDSVIQDGRQTVNKEILKFKQEIKNRYMPKGDDLTEDAALLSSGMKLTQDDLERLWDKHSENLTMQRLLQEHAEKNHIYLNRTYLSEQSKLDAANTMTQFFNSVVQRPNYADTWRSEEWFSSIVPDALRGE